MGEDARTTAEPAANQLAQRVLRMIRAYVTQRVKNRTSKTWDDYKASGYKDRDYRNAVNKVCTDAFLAMRSRKEHRDFLAYWAGTICSVPQFMGGDSDFTDLSLALLDPDKWEDIKSLAMLALSAHSQSDYEVKSPEGQK
ncbi:MAG TPA: hypothetical protein P5304_25210 [Phycisphaerae bacterium]|nr:hypothetical protein [Phycisphaerae bacterium]